MRQKQKTQKLARRIPKGFVVVQVGRDLSAIARPDRWNTGTAGKADKTKVYRPVKHPTSGNPVSKRHLTERERAKLPKPVTLRVPGYPVSYWPDLNSAKAHAIQCARHISADLYRRGLELPEKGVKYQLVYRKNGSISSWYEHTGSITHPFQRVMNVDAGSTAPQPPDNAWMNAPTSEEKRNFQEILKARRHIHDISPPKASVIEEHKVEALFSDRDQMRRRMKLAEEFSGEALNQGQIDYLKKRENK